MIDKYQARIFTAAVLAILCICGAVLAGFGNDSITLAKIESTLPAVVVSAVGIASGFIVFWLLLAHENAWWGNAAGAIAFVLLGAVFGTLLSLIQLLKELTPFLG